MAKTKDQCEKFENEEKKRKKKFDAGIATTDFQ